MIGGKQKINDDSSGSSGSKLLVILIHIESGYFWSLDDECKMRNDIYNDRKHG